jgi:SRSO17 transposase
MAQRRGFREYLAGLLAPRDRNKTLTALAGAEPVTGAQHPAVQRLQFFLSESRWDPELINARRLELLLADPSSAPHGGGVLVIDDSGDRKDGVKTAHVGHQWLGRYGKTDSGVVTVITVWADERLYYPVHAVPYTPARHFARGKGDPAFRTKLQIGADLAVRARGRGVRVPRGGRGQRVRGPGRVPRRTGRGRAAVRDGPQAPPRDLGLRR